MKTAAKTAKTSRIAKRTIKIQLPKTPKIEQQLIDHIVSKLATARARCLEYHRKTNLVHEDELSRFYGEESALESILFLCDLPDADYNPELKIGHIVAPNFRSETSGHLRHGMGTCHYAVVVNLDPFMLISEDGDMLWNSTLNKKDFTTVGYMTKTMCKNVNKRIRGDKYISIPQLVYKPEEHK